MDIELTRGDTPIRAYKLFGDDMEPLDLAGVTVWFTVKSEIDDIFDDSSALMTHHIAIGAGGVASSAVGFEIGGIDPDESSPTYGQLVSGATSGVITQTFPEADSTAMVPGEYLYDLQVKSALGRITTTIRNAKFTVIGDITRRTTTP